VGQRRLRLDLDRAKRFDCCEGAYVAGGEYELSGAGPGGVYSAIVRIYFGSPPTQAMRAAAQCALERLQLPRHDRRRQSPARSGTGSRPAV
jgi:hypothetical protein